MGSSWPASKHQEGWSSRQAPNHPNSTTRYPARCSGRRFGKTFYLGNPCDYLRPRMAYAQRKPYSLDLAPGLGHPTHSIYPSHLKTLPLGVSFAPPLLPADKNQFPMVHR